MPHSQGLFNNPYPDTYFFKIHSNIVSHLRLSLPKDLFPVGVPIKILNALLSSSICAMVVPNHQLSSKTLCEVSEHICFYCVRLLASRQTHKLEDHS